MKKIGILFFISITIVFSSCEDYFGDVNVNPNSPIDVPPSTLLPSVQSILNYSIWGDLSRYVGIFSQHVDGIDRQWTAYQDYIIRGNDVDAFWQSNMYANVVTDIQSLRTAAGDPSENGAYHGIANILEAYTFLVLTDHFGDIPFSEAANKLGDGNLQPGFDAQETVMAECITLLTEGKELLKGESALLPSTDDLIYGGDLVKWEKFANAVLARANLHLAKRDESKYSAALDAALNSFTSFEDDPGVPYEDAKQGPWYQFNDQRGACAVGNNYVALMESFDDPRIDFFGAPLSVDHPILTATAAMPFSTFTEIEFIKAEIYLRNGDLSLADSFYLSGIESSFNKYGIAGYSDYIANALVNPGEGTLSLENIITQKYISLFMDPEVFSDWRRTGFPNLVPNSGTEIPRRLPYPQSETDYNVNCPSPTEVNLFTKVWWDI